MQLIENATDQKLRGAYYTPPVIAKFILQWGINGNNDFIIVLLQLNTKWEKQRKLEQYLCMIQR